MDKGDRVYCLKDGKHRRVDDFVTVRIGQRDVMKVLCEGREFFYDEIMQQRRVNDTWWGRLFFGK
jgi:hypothetical protein